MLVRVTILGELPPHLKRQGKFAELQLDDGCTVGQLKQRLGIGADWLASVDGQVSPDIERLKEQADVTFLVPMEGGALP